MYIVTSTQPLYSSTSGSPRQKIASMPPKNPMSASFINFVLKLVWEVVQPSVSKAVKDCLPTHF